jgi:hypothetical protein
LVGGHRLSPTDEAMLLRAIESVMCETSGTVCQISGTELFLIGIMPTKMHRMGPSSTFRSPLF